MLLDFRRAPVPLKNCFGYLTSKADYATTHCAIVGAGDAKTDFASNSFGYFACYVRIDGGDELREIALQCFQLAARAEVLMLDARFAAKYGLKDGDTVILEPLNKILKAEMIELCPDTFEDWTIFENSAATVEEIFLDQLRLVRPGMQFILYLGSNLPCGFQIKSATPQLPSGGVGSALLVDNDTVVAVEQQRQQHGATISSETSISNSFLGHHHFDDEDIRRFLAPSDKFRRLGLRVAPLPSEKCFRTKIGRKTNVLITVNSKSVYTKTYLVDVYPTPVANVEFEQFPAIWIDISLTDDFEAFSDRNDVEFIRELIPYLQKRNDESGPLALNYCWASAALRRRGGGTVIADCAQLYVIPLTADQLKRAEQIKIIINSTDSDMDQININALKRQVHETLGVVPTGNAPILLESSAETALGESIRFELNGANFNVRFASAEERPEVAKYNYFWPLSQSIRYHLRFAQSGSVSTPKESAKKPRKAVENYALHSKLDADATEFRFQTKLLDELEPAVIAKCLRDVAGYRNRIAHRRLLLLAGADFSGKTTIFKFLARRLFHKCPLVVFPCRLDCAEWKGLSPETIVRRLRMTLDGLLARSPAALFLDNFDFLQHSASDEEHAAAVAGVYSIGELPVIAERVRHKCNIGSSDLLTVSEALSEVINDRPRVGPLASVAKSGVAGTSPALCFSAIGGLDNVKRRLIEIFVWPIKYAKLYSRCGIAIGTRAILHGPTGCGKTMLMRALAAECGARFHVIHVRGPELLSKYIGESEANVRRIFAQARAARPCVLAFDEFDALAPPRGHDSTGVTDRVVNQLLTELDGVENGPSLGESAGDSEGSDSATDAGLYVLAATNRLDAIDRALLRPGRFDHRIEVKPPADPVERTEILRIHTADVPLAADVDLIALAGRCSGWNGAQLRAWVQNAKFRALADDGDRRPTQVVLTASHFDATFEESSPAQLLYTAADYARGKTSGTQKPQKRITLA